MDTRYYIELHGDIITTTTDIRLWGEYMESETRRVARHKTKSYDISTVFLGKNHNYDGLGAPLLYETLAFGGPVDEDNPMERYETREQAVEGHARMVRRMRELEERDATN